MSGNQKFYNSLQGNNNTFHDGNPTGYTHLPAALFSDSISDQEFVKNIVSKMQPFHKMPHLNKSVSITSVSHQLLQTSKALNNIKLQEKHLNDNIDKLTETEWESAFQQIKTQKDIIFKTLSFFSGNNLKMLKKILAKRSAKRLRLRRVRMERKKEKENRMKQLKERSRQIDENLQKIKDAINRVKQEEETKIVVDSVLKEVLRKKHDAKKCIVKMDALIKLRKARENTATGRGETVNASNDKHFSLNIENLTSQWMLKLSQYEKEEAELRSKLKEQCENTITDCSKDEIEKNLAKWQHFLFGGAEMPHADFNGNIQKFISTRSQWDNYINSSGTSLPVGWVVPVCLSND